MNRPDEHHPLKRIQHLLLDELYQRIFQLEVNQQNLETTQENDGILKERLYQVMQREIEQNGGVGRFLERHHLFEDRIILRFILKKCLLFSLIFSLIFFLIISVWLMRYLSSTIPVPDEPRLPLNPPSETIRQLSRYLGETSLPLLITDQGKIVQIKLNSYHLKDLFEIYYWKQHYGVDHTQLSIELPDDFPEYVNLNEKEQFPRFFSYRIDRLSLNRDGVYDIEVTGPTRIWPDELAEIFRNGFGATTRFIYRAIELSPIYFGIGSAELDSTAIHRLDSLADWMESIPRLQLRIVGHADRYGLEKINKAISCRRAEQVERYLMSRHISGNRIRTECYADLQSNESDPARNRKVEFRWEDW